MAMRGESCSRPEDRDTPQEKVLAALSEWQADPASGSNVTVLLVAGLIHTNEENYVEALRAVHGGHNLEMCAALCTRSILHFWEPADWLLLCNNYASAGLLIQPAHAGFMSYTMLHHGHSYAFLTNEPNCCADTGWR